MEAIVTDLPGVRERMRALVMRRLARFYWVPLAIGSTLASRVAAASVSWRALQHLDFGADRQIDVS